MVYLAFLDLLYFAMYHRTFSYFNDYFIEFFLEMTLNLYIILGIIGILILFNL